jgi:hypothetical protein
VDWLDKEAKVPPLFGRLIIKTLALLADKSGKEAGKYLLKFIRQHLPFATLPVSCATRKPRSLKKETEELKSWKTWAM